MAQQTDDHHVHFVKYSQRGFVREKRKVKRLQSRVIAFVALAGIVALGLIFYFAKNAGAEFRK